MYYEGTCGEHELNHFIKSFSICFSSKYRWTSYAFYISSCTLFFFFL